MHFLLTVLCVSHLFTVITVVCGVRSTLMWTVYEYEKNITCARFLVRLTWYILFYMLKRTAVDLSYRAVIDFVSDCFWNGFQYALILRLLTVYFGVTLSRR